MAILNRFPLLGLWAKEAALRLGYAVGEAKALGHAYAVLYAIRAAAPRVRHEEKAAAKPARKHVETEQIDFSGDKIDITRDANGKVLGLVGHEQPQTARSYRSQVEAKFPDDYYEKLEKAFRAVWHTIPPGQIKDRRVYKVYDQWKKLCGVGREVDLDKLLDWCEKAGKQTARPSRRTTGPPSTKRPRPRSGQ